MSIVKFYEGRREMYIPTCDVCGIELRPEYYWLDAVAAKKNFGWRTYKNENGEWIDMCDDCKRRAYERAMDK